MLEGKELEHKLGNYGSAFVDLASSGVVEVGVSLKVDLVAELEKLALRSDNSIDDKLVALIKAALSKPADVPAEA
jgi:hypothetical protein